NRKVEYSLESKMADKLYKAYINDGISRIEKVNGRFLASQTLKLDMIIEQNNTIIQLLKEIRDKE
ncbi:MAG: zinc ribbon domain-containing protein, partial [Methanobrevibacter sp.]|nr:zinc ribbon domain-containing protein [Methanobrevibacter sp.]